MVELDDPATRLSQAADPPFKVEETLDQADITNRFIVEFIYLFDIHYSATIDRYEPSDRLFSADKCYEFSKIND